MYSKGVPQIKSSQSCRNTGQEALIHPQINKLCAVKEIEEEQMGETFTRLNKKLTQPQQKEISKKNTPRQNRKMFGNINQKASSQEVKEKDKQSRSKQSRSKHQRSKVNIGTQKLTIGKQKLETNLPECAKVELKTFNLPSINKNASNLAKIDHSLVGFATRSLSKNSSLKLKRSNPTIPQEPSQNPPMLSNPSTNASLINVPKKYQFRAKRLNIDSQSISSSKNSKLTSDSIQRQLANTKSGPIKNEITLDSTKNGQSKNPKKLTLENNQKRVIEISGEINKSEKENVEENAEKIFKKRIDLIKMLDDEEQEMIENISTTKFLNLVIDWQYR